MNPADAPSMNTAAMEAPNGSAQPQDDPLVQTWFNRIKAAEKHWDKFHKRVRYNRKLVRGIDDSADPATAGYNKHRANLIQSTLAVVLSKVYAKNPEMAGTPTNKARDLALFSTTVSTVTQTMLESAKLKKKAKASVKAAMTCAFGVVKVQYQKDMRTDPVILQRIEDSQNNIQHIESLLAEIEDDAQRCDLESKKRELEEAVKSLESSKEVVAAEGLVIDRVRTERLLVDPVVDDIWEYEQADWLGERVFMRKSAAMGRFPGVDLSKAATFKLSDDTKSDRPSQMYSSGVNSDAEDPMLLVYEIWNKLDAKIYTLIDGIRTQFVREPYQPAYAGERWYPYFLLPFQSVDGEFVAQSLVDVLEKLQDEHNETRDKFAEVRRNHRPHYIASGDLREKDIRKMVHPQIGEIVIVDANGQPLRSVIEVAQQLPIDPAVYDTSPIRNDWEMVSGLQDAARSTVISPKTATEASISDQALAARVAEFRDQIEDWLTEISQYASDLCLLAMTSAQVEQIMGRNEVDEVGNVVNQAYVWPVNPTPDSVFSLIEMQIRAGSTAAPNKLQVQENWSKAMPLIQQSIAMIRQLDASGVDSTPERELLRETAARFDETIDVDRFLPPMPPKAPPVPTTPEIPGAMPGMPTPGGLPLQTPPTPLQ